MLSVKAIDIYENILDLGSPVSLTLSKDKDVPADSLVLSIGDIDVAELKALEVYRDGDLVFSGEVDEQIEELSGNPHTELVARSSASRLIDSEAYPMSFVNPSAEDIFERYAKPFGFTLKGENREYRGSFTVAKGTSCFAVIKTFAKEVYGTLPRCEGDVLYIDGLKNSGKLVLGEGVVHFESMRVSKLRCNRISKVLIKLKDSDGYEYAVVNSNAEREGINKIRYLNASLGSSADLLDADEIIADGEKKSFALEVVCRDFLADALGKTAEAEGINEELYVSALKVTLSKNGEYTKLTLKRKEN